jgi:hypothetical protein
MSGSVMRPHSLAAVAALLLLCTCGPDPSATPEIVLEKPKEASTELVFRIARHDRRPDGSQSLSAVGMLHGKTVGFDLELGPWRENPPGYVNMTTWDCKALLRSQGDASDELLRFLDELYLTHLTPTHMVASLELQAFSPWKNPGAFEDGGAKFLLLFPAGFEFDQAGELRIEVDLDDARLYVREKDERLRLAVIKPLCAAS